MLVLVTGLFGQPSLSYRIGYPLLLGEVFMKELHRGIVNCNVEYTSHFYENVDYSIGIDYSLMKAKDYSYYDNFFSPDFTLRYRFTLRKAVISQYISTGYTLLWFCRDKIFSSKEDNVQRCPLYV